MLKKSACLLFVLALSLAALTGCKSASVKSIDVAGTTAKLASDVTWKDQLSEISPSSKALKLYGIDEAAVANASVYLSTNATAEEIAIFEAASADQVGTIETAVNNRVDAQKASFETYNPDEMPKLNNPYIETRGNYVILVVCDDTQEAKDVVEEAFK